MPAFHVLRGVYRDIRITWDVFVSGGRTVQSTAISTFHEYQSPLESVLLSVFTRRKKGIADGTPGRIV